MITIHIVKNYQHPEVIVYGQILDRLNQWKNQTIDYWLVHFNSISNYYLPLYYSKNYPTIKNYIEKQPINLWDDRWLDD